MFKAISQLFEKGKEVDLVVDSPESDDEMKRMTQMRTRITHNKLKALKNPDQDGETQNSQNLITRAKNSELGESHRGSATLLSEEGKQSISILEDWQSRISHLPGFDVDPQY